LSIFANISYSWRKKKPYKVSFYEILFSTTSSFGVSAFGGSGSNFLFNQTLPFSLFISIISNSTSSQTFTTSSTFTTLVAANFEI
jgi:hypothetical protein